MNGQHTVHLINPLWNPAGGSEWRMLHLYRTLKPHCEVLLWGTIEPDPGLAAAYPIRLIGPGQPYPVGGTLVFVGVYFNFYPDWLRFVRPRRVIVIYNTNSPDRLQYMIDGLAHCGLSEVDIVFASEALKRSVGLEGTVQPSLIDIDVFAPGQRTASLAQAFTVGRLSRDVPEKHHPLDPQLYRRLVQAGCRVRIMGGTCLSEPLRGEAGVELLPAGALPPQDFLHELDCLFYRTSEQWYEASGRVVSEAMSCGLPVVCHSSGGYREIIEQGKNGFVFDDDEQAFQIIMQLRQDKALRVAIGAAARLSMERRYSPQAHRVVVNYYLR